MELIVSIFVGGLFKGSKKIMTPCLIGRSKEAGLTVAHASMSRKHCELFEEAGKLYLRDNSSLNGTLYHGEYVENPVPIQLGDEFTIGELTFRVTPTEATGQYKAESSAEKPTDTLRIDPDNDGGDSDAGMVTAIDLNLTLDDLSEEAN